ncbi:MAG TPA: hypothetical protein VFG25_02045 [Nitrosopumilaceae archaeon]|nr:hypothetical protein [Nitrosopumilaceae archaeon]
MSEPVGEKNPIPHDTHFMLDISKLTCAIIYGIVLDLDNPVDIIQIEKFGSQL